MSYLQVQGSVVEGELYLLSPDLEDVLECVDFGCTYYGTDKTESAVLYNCGPEPISFVTVLDENAIGQEVVSMHGKCVIFYLFNIQTSFYLIFQSKQI